ncbi:M3 family oligoendopeptidase [Spongorhabdus nitratireducens]
MTVKNDKSIPVWDNRHIYADLSDSKIQQDCETVQGLVQQLEKLAQRLARVTDDEHGVITETLIEALQVHDKAVELVWTMDVFAYSTSSVDAKNEAAAKLIAKSGDLGSLVEQAYKPVELYLLRAPEAFIDTFLGLDEIRPYRFYIANQRKQSAHLLSADEEVTITALSTDGFHSWGRLYEELSGSLRCNVDGEELGLASAFNLTLQQDAEKRRTAWEAIQNAWRSREETAAAILNAINGWRREEIKLRSKQQPQHYLDVTCHHQRIERSTLDALMQATEERKTLGHRALAGMAKGLGIDKLGPQDILAPCPQPEGEQGYYSFEKAVDLVVRAFSRFDPEMGDFARQMYDNNWIDAKPTENRSTGAYCTQFANVREPRVFMTWDGSVGNVITLAHELGHAWHNWVMKDQTWVESDYPSTLAETASIFAETLVRDALFEEAQSDADRMEVAWQDAESAAAFLVNIPARFEFEKRLVEKRDEGYLPAAELSELMEQSWAKWYEDSITEYTPMFWATKLHFSLTGLSFYNYPYLFGYLFSLGVYAQKERLGAEFSKAYVALLRDTGTMTAEELIQKHLGRDIRQPEFWHDSLDLVEKLMIRFEQLLEQKQ